MIEYDNMRPKANIAQMLEKSVAIFYNTGLYDLAEKWDRILKNYRKARQYR